VTDDWALVLPEKINRRIENGDLVIWRPGFTVWIAVWNGDKPAQQTLSWIKETASPEAIDGRAPSLYCYAVTAAQPSADGLSTSMMRRPGFGQADMAQPA
jgi:hypothetical protein